jgi:hypothetical protein
VTPSGSLINSDYGCQRETDNEQLMHGLADITADVLAALHYAARWRRAIANDSGTNANARRCPQSDQQDDIVIFEYG